MVRRLNLISDSCANKKEIKGKRNKTGRKLCFQRLILPEFLSESGIMRPDSIPRYLITEKLFGSINVILFVFFRTGRYTDTYHTPRMPV